MKDQISLNKTNNLNRQMIVLLLFLIISGPQLHNGNRLVPG